jgi:hypothetical protein
MPYNAPGLYYEVVDTARSGVPVVRTDVAAFVGVALKGPLHTPVTVQSWAQFQGRFGGFLNGPFLACSVKAFFENGGAECRVVRVAAPAAEAVLDLASPQPADPTFAVVDKTGGFVPGAVVTILQGTNTWDVLLAAVDPVSRKLTFGAPLDPAYNPALGASFFSGIGSAAGVLRAATGDPAIEVSAESPGFWGNSIEVRAAGSSTFATASRSGVPQPTARTSSFVNSVAGLAPFTLLKVFQDQSPAVPVETWHVVASVDPFDSRIVWDQPLEAAFDLTKPFTMESREFSLSVFESGRLREVFANLSLDARHERYVEKAIGEGTSNLIRARDLGAPVALQYRIPSPQAVRLAAGRNGTAALTADDFLGNPASQTRTGLRTLELVSGIGMVAIPDLVMQPAPPRQFALPPPVPADPCSLCPPPPPTAAPPPPPMDERIPALSLNEVFRAQQTLIEHCIAMKYRIALLDPPLFSKPGESVDIAEIQSWRARFDSSFATLTFPWVLVYDPLQPASRLVRSVPPSGHAAGIYARNDLQHGPHYAPANQPLNWAQDVTLQIDAGLHGLLNPLGINCIRVFPGRGLLLYGARTVSSDPIWIYVNVRRLMCMIQESLEVATQWAVFEPNDERLRRLLTMAISGFLTAQWRRGALKGQRAEDAFYVRCDASNNTSEMAGNGMLLAEVGVAPVIPAEFVVVRVGRTRDTLEITESSMGTGGDPWR